MNPTPVVIIEDDPDIAGLLQHAFTSNGFAVTRCGTGEEGLTAVEKTRAELVVLDVMLPGIDGIEVLKQIRQGKNSRCAVIMLTAKGEEIDRVVGFELGADDYVVKPFSVRELVLRAKALLRRGAVAEEAKPVTSLGSLTIDEGAHRVFLHGQEVTLTATEFKLLLELVRHRGQALGRDALLSAVWGYDFDGYARTVDTHMRRLRQKLGDDFDGIETLRGVGYRFKAV